MPEPKQQPPASVKKLQKFGESMQEGYNFQPKKVPGRVGNIASKAASPAISVGKGAVSGAKSAYKKVKQTPANAERDFGGAGKALVVSGKAVINVGEAGLGKAANKVKKLFGG